MHGATDKANYQLRDYQTDAITAVEKSWAAGHQRTAAVLPTGGGKTIVFSHIIAQAGEKTLAVAHRDELIEQAAAKIRAVAPGLRVGVVKAERDEHQGADVVVASVQTLAQPRRRRRIEGIGLVVVDEAHHAVARTYRETLKHFGCFTPGGPRALGVTATMARSDNESLGEVWEEIAYQLDILDLIDQGHLADVRGISVQLSGLDLSKVKTTGRGGDYRTGDLAEQMGDVDAWTAAADAYVEHASDRRGIAFTPTVESAHQTAEMLCRRGIVAEAVDGTTPTDERRDILARFETGATQVLANCGVLTEGYDAPWCSAVLIARPTSSDVLFVQMAGRGLRPHPGKRDALIIDLVGVTAGRKLATLACLTGREIGELPEGVSLTEAREQHLTRSHTASPYLGGLTAAEVDLFDRDGGVIWPDWRGVRYIDVSKLRATVYIAPSAEAPGSYDVIARDRTNGDEHILASGCSFRRALHGAERFAAERGSHLVRRGYQWRGRAATDKQRATLERWKVPVPDGCTSGEASELISAHIVSRDFTHRPPRGFIPRQGRRP